MMMIVPLARQEAPRHMIVQQHVTGSSAATYSLNLPSLELLLLPQAERSVKGSGHSRRQATPAELMKIIPRIISEAGSTTSRYDKKSIIIP
jgi:hypothetical protein